MILNSYSDPSHGWAKIKRETLRKLGILHKISSYSYQRGDFVYLEEDADLTLLVKTLEAKGEKLEFRGHTNPYKRSRIRGYASFGLRPGDCV